MIEWVAVWGVAQVGGAIADPLPWLKERAEHDENYCVRQVAVQELARGWKSDPDMCEFFCDIFLMDQFKRQYNPRQIALDILFKSYRENSQTLEVFLDRAEQDLDEKVQDFAKEY